MIRVITILTVTHYSSLLGNRYSIYLGMWVTDWVIISIVHIQMGYYQCENVVYNILKYFFFFTLSVEEEEQLKPHTKANFGLRLTLYSFFYANLFRELVCGKFATYSPSRINLKVNGKENKIQKNAQKTDKSNDIVKR